MSGVTKHVYDHDIQDIQKEWTKQIKAISKVLPYGYVKEDIIDIAKDKIQEDGKESL